MKEEGRNKLRKTAAALFILGVVAAVPIVMLAWGRGIGGGAALQPAAGGAGQAEQPEPPPGAGAETPGTQGAGDVIPSDGAVWPVRLGPEDRAYLVGLFMDCVGAGPSTHSTSSGPSAAAVGVPAPPACLEATNAPVFVTIYAVRTPPQRTMEREANLAASVRQAAQSLLERAGGRLKGEVLRVRVDVLCEARPFPADRRLEFARRVFGEPAGLALKPGDWLFFLPSEAVDFTGWAHEGILSEVCRRAGLEPAAWQRPETRMWLLTADSFVNSAPGSRYALPCPRGLPPVGEPTIARVLRAGRLAADYLAHVQKKDGSYQTFWNPAAGLRGGCDSVPEQASAAAALAALCEARPSDEYLASCKRALAYLMQYTDSDATDRKMAFTRREEVCHVVWELEASAGVLEAMCRYRHASGLSEPDAWIAALAKFLLFMQRDDGLFELKYDAESRSRTTPAAGAAQVVPQAKAALALALAYRELSVPSHLVGAEKALSSLLAQEESRKEPYSADEARWIMSALCEVNGLDPSPEYGAWAIRIVDARLKYQLKAQDVPSADLAGGTLVRFPPTAEPTADDLVVFAAACMMETAARQEGLAAARQAAGFVMQLQYLPENSYYLPDPEPSLGGFREQLGSNIIRIQTTDAALRGLAMLAQLEMQGVGKR